MPPDRRRGRPGRVTTPRQTGPHVEGPHHTDIVRVTPRGDGAGARSSAGDLEAWAAAVLHLHAAGLPAAVPEFAAAWLARRGVYADWRCAA